MTMIKESYERLMMDVTEFDSEDVITTSGVGPGGIPSYYDDGMELWNGSNGAVPPNI